MVKTTSSVERMNYKGNSIFVTSKSGKQRYVIFIMSKGNQTPLGMFVLE